MLLIYRTVFIEDRALINSGQRRDLKGHAEGGLGLTCAEKSPTKASRGAYCLFSLVERAQSGAKKWSGLLTSRGGDADLEVVCFVLLVDVSDLFD